MPIAAVKLVDGARGGIVAVDGVAGARDAELALVPCMLKQAVQLGFHPPQPLQGHVGVVGAGTPTLQGFEDAFVHAQALTPSIDEGVQPKIKTAPRRASPTRFVVDSSSSTPTLHGLPFLQGPMEDLLLFILGQKARHLTPKRLFLTHCFRVSTHQLWVRVPAFITPRGKKT